MGLASRLTEVRCCRLCSFRKLVGRFFRFFVLNIIRAVVFCVFEGRDRGFWGGGFGSGFPLSEVCFHLVLDCHPDGALWHPAHVSDGSDAPLLFRKLACSVATNKCENQHSTAQQPRRNRLIKYSVRRVRKRRLCSYSQRVPPPPPPPSPSPSLGRLREPQVARDACRDRSLTWWTSGATLLSVGCGSGTRVGTHGQGSGKAGALTRYPSTVGKAAAVRDALETTWSLLYICIERDMSLNDWAGSHINFCTTEFCNFKM